jgi:hypothetical protein
MLDGACGFSAPQMDAAGALPSCTVEVEAYLPAGIAISSLIKANEAADSTVV